MNNDESGHWPNSSRYTPDAPSLTPSRPAPPAPRGSRGQPDQTYRSHERLQATPQSTPNNYTTGMTGMLSTPSGSGSTQTIIRRGWVGVKEDGLRAWIWSKRWLILREQTLTFHKNEVRDFGVPKLLTEQIHLVG